MSADLYAAVIADLEAKRDGLNELIAALRNVSRMQPGQVAAAITSTAQAEKAIAAAARAEKAVGRSVGRSVQDACHAA